jgi:hypothetical protein
MKTQEARIKQSVLAVTVTVGLAWVYCLIVLFMYETVLGYEILHRYLAIGVILGFCLTYWLARRAARRNLTSLSTLNSISLTTAFSLCTLLAADTAYNIYLNIGSVQSDSMTLSERRLHDPNIWVGELHPRDYFPTESNWHIFKPNITITGTHYGWAYTPDMLKSPTLSKSVLERHHVSFSIDRYGFRETSALEEARIFVLGDSFTYGWGLDQEQTWPELIEKSLEQPVYNLGTHDASPKQEVMMLDYLLREQVTRVEIHELFWMIYEGNDLEFGYGPLVTRKNSIRDLAAGTILESIWSIPGTIKNQSIIHNLRSGRSAFHGLSRSVPTFDPFEIDGVKLATPLYHSAQFGYRFFVPHHLDILNKPASYVQNHPNRPALDRAFSDMAALARKHHFNVTVLIVPTAERLYASYFEHFPDVTEKPHFIHYVEDLSRQVGLKVINLEALMKPYAEKELLYFRDDDHLNRRGSEVIAQIILEHRTRGLAVPNALQTPLF